jgi:hypothetical protein
MYIKLKNKSVTSAYVLRTPVRQYSNITEKLTNKTGLQNFPHIKFQIMQPNRCNFIVAKGEFQNCSRLLDFPLPTLSGNARINCYKKKHYLAQVIFFKQWHHKCMLISANAASQSLTLPRIRRCYNNCCITVSDTPKH